MNRFDKLTANRFDRLTVKKYDLLITGVGGQGNILASDIAGEVALAAGYDVKKTDTLGMAQRGGSVISHVRIANQVFSPLIKDGEVDFLLAFEKLEGVRWASSLKPGAIVIMNNYAQPPLSVSLGVDRYPTDKEVKKILKQCTDRIYLVAGTSGMTKLGNVRTLNIFMLGCLSRFLPFKVEAWKQSIVEHLPKRLHKINTAAFELGRKEISNVHVG
ncbi:MAG: indolepyruvate oxidoreductase subunit beta [Dehalococcoidales bacterium]|nr:indolepyruvate oxidoreductase subunit beta [Dehalococcoidales bacterium]